MKDSLQERFLVGVLSKEDNPSNSNKTVVDIGDTVDVDSIVDEEEEGIEEEEEETLGIEEEEEEDSDDEVDLDDKVEGDDSGFDYHENFLGMARSASTSSK